MTELIVATKNNGKIQNFKKAFKNLGLSISGIDLDHYPHVDETGKTFFENAFLKASSATRFYKKMSLGDDSGISVEALDFRPNIYSHRYASENPTDEENIQKMLYEMKGKTNRKAFYTTCLVVTDIDPNTGHVYVVDYVESRTYGTITEEPRGTGGFAYDVIFVPDGETRTLAEMSDDERLKFLSRGKAISAIAEKLSGVID